MSHPDRRPRTVALEAKVVFQGELTEAEARSVAKLIRGSLHGYALPIEWRLKQSAKPMGRLLGQPCLEIASDDQVEITAMGPQCQRCGLPAICVVALPDGQRWPACLDCQIHTAQTHGSGAVRRYALP